MGAFRGLLAGYVRSAPQACVVTPLGDPDLQFMNHCSSRMLKKKKKMHVNVTVRKQLLFCVSLQDSQQTADCSVRANVRVLESNFAFFKKKVF